jgi:hypothetical protein
MTNTQAGVSGLYWAGTYTFIPRCSPGNILEFPIEKPKVLPRGTPGCGRESAVSLYGPGIIPGEFSSVTALSAATAVLAFQGHEIPAPIRAADFRKSLRCMCMLFIDTFILAYMLEYIV